MPIAELKKAYARTLALKYGDDKSSKFAELMNKELEKVDKGSLANKKKTSDKGVVDKGKQAK